MPGAGAGLSNDNRRHSLGVAVPMSIIVNLGGTFPIHIAVPKSFPVDPLSTSFKIAPCSGFGVPFVRMTFETSIHSLTEAGCINMQAEYGGYCEHKG